MLSVSKHLLFLIEDNQSRRRGSARMIHLCSAKVTHTKNRIWRSASVCQHHHPRRGRVSPLFHEGGSQWGPDKNAGLGFGAGQNTHSRHRGVGHSSRANHGNFSQVPKKADPSLALRMTAAAAFSAC
jgi:hypothetical protein